jgi:hypothetical protein
MGGGDTPQHCLIVGYADCRTVSRDPYYVRDGKPFATEYDGVILRRGLRRSDKNSRSKACIGHRTSFPSDKAESVPIVTPLLYSFQAISMLQRPDRSDRRVSAILRESATIAILLAPMKITKSDISL